ncbi:uncharacterized protein LOC121778982 [Salvia splendens]|uniref:uncharacterized protein LOC121778982 n=1 Tax=Salvia splendens TaxID=180675 RepID=UPI001C273496|nr:uncharacterized protein LOC121778982 [Salvia splendens]
MAPEPEDQMNDEKNPKPLDEDDIALLKTYGLGPYSTSIKKAEKEIKEMAKKINDLCDSPGFRGRWLASDDRVLQHVPVAADDATDGRRVKCAGLAGGTADATPYADDAGVGTWDAATGAADDATAAGDAWFGKRLSAVF